MTRIAVDATHVYLASDTGDVHRVRKDDASPPELVTRIDVVDHYPRAIAIVGDWVYVAAGTLASRTNSPFSLYRAKKCGGRARRIARDYLLFGTLFPAGNHFYFGRVGRLARLEITE